MPTAFDATFPEALAGAFILGFGLNLLRYIVMAGSAFTIFHKWLPNRLAHRAVPGRTRSPEQNKRDMLYSVSSMFIFGMSLLVMIYVIKAGWTKMYTDINEYGWLWWMASLPIMLVIHDTYFYFSHRLMHHKRLFPLFHKVHHLSRDPTPLTSYAFHPLEAIVEAGIGPVIICLLPVHHSAMLIFITIQFAQNVLGHLGYELYPRWFAKTPLRYILSTTTHHHQHHQTFNYNFALYFNVWDRVLGTNHPQYDELLIRNTSQPLVRSDVTTSWSSAGEGEHPVPST